MITERLKKQIEFMLEIDRMKNIYRQTYVLGENRKENDAEHSWHLAILAFLMSEYANSDVDVLKTMKMVLIHDIVEIDAGDTYGYDDAGNATKAEREEKAANRIFSILPDDLQMEFYSLWREFEESETPEAKFALTLDRFHPLVLNYMKDGISWKEHDISANQVTERMSPCKDGSAQLAEVIDAIISDAAQKGFLKTD